MANIGNYTVDELVGQLADLLAVTGTATCHITAHAQEGDCISVVISIHERGVQHPQRQLRVVGTRGDGKMTIEVMARGSQH